MNNLSIVVQEQLLAFLNFLPRVVLALLVMVICWLIAKYATHRVRKWLQKRVKETPLTNLFSQLANFLIVIIGLAIALDLIGLGGIANSLIAGAGVSALVIGFALKDIGENLLSGIALAFNPPFNPTDLIETGGVSGEVRSINVRTTHLRSLEGKDIYVPNSNILKGPITNFTRQGVIKVEVDYDLKPTVTKEDATQVILSAVMKIPNVAMKPNPIIEIRDLTGSKLNVQLHYWITAQNQSLSNLVEIKSEVIWQTKSALLKAQLI